ncbi:MAG: hypothetical protein NXY57DRAFT_965660 [Lentinula lateritia]|nr:MAG: hypothetical protein NXY57DRAFT_965660 [Lentinula lateritia]
MSKIVSHDPRDSSMCVSISSLGLFQSFRDSKATHGMSSYSYLPNSVAHPLFADRTRPNGVYDRLAKSFMDMGPAALANAEVNEHFFHHNFGESWSTNYSYWDCNSLQFSANVFSKVVGQAFGTYAGAQGNHYAGRDPKNPIKITDSTKVKCTFVLGCPTNAPASIQNLFYNQICTLDGMRDVDRIEEQVDVKEIVKSLRSGGEADALVLTGEPLYTVMKKENGKKQSESQRETVVHPRSKLAKCTVDGDLKLVDVEVTLDLPDSIVNPVVGPAIPKQHEIYLGAEYDHRLMPDFGGPVFTLDKAKLVQPNWQNVKNDFITPWMNYDQLRPGVLVVANIGIRVYVLTPKYGSGNIKKIYHATINSMKVVAESPIPVTPPSAISRQGKSLKATVEKEVSAAASALDAIVWRETTSGREPGESVCAVDVPTERDGAVADGKRKKQRK